MPAGFRFIDQYRTLVKDLEQSCDDVLDFAQESRHFLEDVDVKPEIKLETEDSQPDIFNMMDIIMNSNTSDASVNNNKNGSNFYSNIRLKNVFTSSTGGQNRLTPVSTIPTVSSSAITTPTLSLLTSSPSPTISSATLPVLSPFSTNTSSLSMPPNFTSTKTSTFVTELGGSGCTVVSNTNFLLDTTNTMSTHEDQEDGLEYTDLDKPSMLLYSDYDSFSNLSKPGVVSDESNSVPLEEAVFMMTDTIQNDCDSLNIPYDPMNWSTEHVRRWVSWVCHRNHVPDVSSNLYQFDGPSMCSLTHDALLSLGEAGIKISNELELLKAANSCFPNHLIGVNIDARSQNPCNPYIDNLQAFSFTSCVSPAPSACDSTHDSNTSTLSTHSDHSDDESGYGSHISNYSASSKLENASDRITAKAPTGRGHKQTIHLWQFLRELLLSKDTSYSDCIRWLDRKAGVFKIEDSKRVASLWGARKNRPAMNYDKLSRSVRQYYKKGIIKKTEQSKRLVYQFCAGYM